MSFRLPERCESSMVSFASDLQQLRYCFNRQKPRLCADLSRVEDKSYKTSKGPVIRMVSNESLDSVVSSKSGRENLTDIVPRPADVLLGLGNNREHEGTKYLRRLGESYLEKFKNSDKKTKNKNYPCH